MAVRLVLRAHLERLVILATAVILALVFLVLVVHQVIAGLVAHKEPAIFLVLVVSAAHQGLAAFLVGQALVAGLAKAVHLVLVAIRVLVVIQAYRAIQE